VVTLNNQQIAEKNFDEFKRAISKDLIKCQQGEIHSDILVHVDRPDGTPRFTYGLMGSSSRLKASCVAVTSAPYNGKQCFDVGVATFEKFRKQGHGKLILEKAIDELKNGLNRNGINEFYIELKVDEGNEASHRLCNHFCDETIDKDTGRIYLKLIK
jgi:GNAT superfamily N-acetyltransferase